MGLTHPPGAIAHAQVRPYPLFQLGRINLNLSEDGGVVHLDAAIEQHELAIAVTDGKHQIPTHRPQDHLRSELPAFEGLILPRLSRLSPFRHGAAYTWPRSRRKAATEPDLERGACRMINAEGISPTDLKPEICIRAFQRKFSA